MLSVAGLLGKALGHFSAPSCIDVNPPSLYGEYHSHSCRSCTQAQLP